jgi:hypothetical protein
MNLYIGPFRRFDNRRVDREIDEELQFHLDLLTEEHCRQDISWDEAQASALERFGNVAQIRDECLRIARRNSPAVLALKWFLGFVFVAGVLLRVFSTEFHLTRVGDILMEIGVLGRLLLYLRGATRSKYLQESDDSSPLKLSGSRLPLDTYDQNGRTPVERILSSK